MANNKVLVGDIVLLDLTQDSVTSGTLARGVTAHDKSGQKITGTLEVPATEEKMVELSMPSGNQVIRPSTGKVLSKVTIQKPSTLTEGNIKKGVNIGGVTGTLEAGGAGDGYNIQSDTNADGTQTLVITDADSDLITLHLDVDFSNQPDDILTIWETYDGNELPTLTIDNHAIELKVKRGSVVPISAGFPIDGATTEENAQFDIASIGTDYVHQYRSGHGISTYTYMLGIGTADAANAAQLSLYFVEG